MCLSTPKQKQIVQIVHTQKIQFLKMRILKKTQKDNFHHFRKDKDFSKLAYEIRINFS